MVIQIFNHAVVDLKIQLSLINLQPFFPPEIYQSNFRVINVIHTAHTSGDGDDILGPICLAGLMTLDLNYFKQPAFFIGFPSLEVLELCMVMGYNCF